MIIKKLINLPLTKAVALLFFLVFLVILALTIIL